MELLILPLLPALFIFMVDYGLGHPADEKVGYGSFLFKYSFYLAQRRMKNAGLYGNYYGQYIQQLASAKNDLEKHRIKRSFQELIFTQGRELFTWEKAFGMCPYCTHFWAALIFISINIFLLKLNFITLVYYLALSHLLIRTFKRWI